MRSHRHQHRKRIRRAIKNDHWKWELIEVLLIPQILIHAKDRVEAGSRGTVKQRTVLEGIPTHLAGRLHIVTGQQPSKALWKIVVEQNPQSRSRSFSRSSAASSRTATACSRVTPSKS